MWEAAHDEERHTKQQWQVLSLAGKGHCSGHDETATYGQHTASERSHGQSALQNLLRCFLQRHRAASHHQRHQQAAYQVSTQDEQQLSHFTFLDKTRSARVELQRIVNHGEKAKGKQHSTNDAFLCQIAKSGNTDTDSCQYGGAEELVDRHTFLLNNIYLCKDTKFFGMRLKNVVPLLQIMGKNDLFTYRQFIIHQEHAAMKVGTDCDLLGTLSQGGDRILDIGTGTGVLSLMLAQRYPQAQLTAVEIDDNAVMDATRNFQESPFAERIRLIHASFQDFLGDQPLESFDSVVCNPPYFDKSIESPDLGRTRARHTSSLPFSVLTGGAYSLLKDGGVFSVCIPPEVLDDFLFECQMKGFWLQDIYKIKSVPEKAPKRYVLVHRKGQVLTPREHIFCMRNTDRTRSQWYSDLMREFHL